MRWRLHLLEIDFKAIKPAEISHPVANAFSRVPREDADDTVLDEDVPAMLRANNAEPGADHIFPCFR